LFALIFIAAGVTSEVARLQDWNSRRPINLFENTYRMGSLVFGGGKVGLMGLLAELLVRTYHESQDKAIYAVREKIGFE